MKALVFHRHTFRWRASLGREDSCFQLTFKKNCLKNFTRLLARADTITCSKPQRSIFLRVCCVVVLCLRGWSRSGGRKCRAVEREERKEDSEYRTADDPLWHLQRCAGGLWAMYDGGERQLQGHDTAMALFQTEMRVFPNDSFISTPLPLWSCEAVRRHAYRCAEERWSHN